MTDGRISRRAALGTLAAATWSAAFRWTPEEVERAARLARTAKQAQAPYQAKFFTPHEWETVRVLVDIIIPRDDRSGSATDAGVPEFMDFMISERTEAQVAMRGGLAWLDAECWERFGKTFLDASVADRTAMLDDIAWPKKAKPELSHGVTFFNGFRDLTASGFWSSRIGIEDLQYQGNTFIDEWKGCSDAALRKLDVHYED